MTAKKLYTKKDMNKLAYSKNETENSVGGTSFITSFLSSLRQKMYGKRKFQCAITESNNKATILVILIIGFTAGPAVSL